MSQRGFIENVNLFMKISKKIIKTLSFQVSVKEFTMSLLLEPYTINHPIISQK